jgi:predicted PurR-regulated permease PerM
MTPIEPINPSATLVLAPTGAPARTPFTIVALRLIGFCLAVLTVIAAGFAAYAAREFLIPIAVAFLLAIMLSPVARKLERGLSSTLSAGVVTLGVVGLLAGLLTLTIPEMAALSQQLPRAMSQVEDKIAAARETLGTIERASEEIQQAGQEAGVTPESDTVVVQQATPLSVALTSIARLLAQTAASLLLTFFLLAQRRRMKTIVVAMARTHTTRKRLLNMFNDIKTRISTYLLAITLTSLGVGAASAVALYLIGFPNPWLWGVAVALANFVPYAGPAAVQLLALVVGALTYPTFLEAVAPALVLWVLNFIEGHIITPLFVARRVVLNPLSVFLAIVFGGWIWGVVGAVVAVPALIVAASIIQHWWAPCSTESRRPAPASWRGWTFDGNLPAIRLRRAGLHVRAGDVEVV